MSVLYYPKHKQLFELHVITKSSNDEYVMGEKDKNIYYITNDRIPKIKMWIQWQYYATTNENSDIYSNSKA